MPARLNHARRGGKRFCRTGRIDHEFLIAPPTDFVERAVSHAKLFRGTERRLMHRNEARERIFLDRNKRRQHRRKIIAEHACEGAFLDASAPNSLDGAGEWCGEDRALVVEVLGDRNTVGRRYSDDFCESSGRRVKTGDGARGAVHRKPTLTTRADAATEDRLHDDAGPARRNSGGMRSVFDNSGEGMPEYAGSVDLCAESTGDLALEWSEQRMGWSYQHLADSGNRAGTVAQFCANLGAGSITGSIAGSITGSKLALAE
jgi:hypothetical protein